METAPLINVSLSQFKTFFPDAPCVESGDDVYLLDARLQQNHKPVMRPCRLDGYMLLYCVEGHMKLTVNLTDFEVRKNMIFMNVPGNIVRVDEIIGMPQENVNYLCLAMSREFVHGMHVDVNKLFNEGMSMLENPCIELTASQIRILENLFGTIADTIKSDAHYRREMLHSQITAMFYLLMGAWAEKTVEVDESLQSNRSKVMFDKFIRLVAEHYHEERNVGFYADKLCLTPKYLSKLIKMATGRSAPEWIDSYVILEAKNLLKYSNVTIKEIVYKLNFPNQSVFYKFFKARTGMTPTEYRNA